MSKGQFDKAFNELTHRRREVLLKFLAYETDEAIAQSLNISQATVRQHIKVICEEFGLENEFPDERRSKRADLMALFQRYKPELVVGKTPRETATLEQINQNSIADKNFVGRESAIAHLNNFDSQGAKVILIQAKGGVGKTTLARNYLQQKDYYNFQIEAYYGLAFIYSITSFKEKAQDFANKSYNSSKDDSDELSEWSIGHRYIFLGLTYKNLGDTQKAFQMYNQAVTFADDNHYAQIKARALTGLAELYRRQQEFETAFSYHSKAIEVLEKIGAKCDLAEGYYQLGLTYQKMKELAKSRKNFDKAILLFREIEAPKQVEKVRHAMENSENNSAT
ncbi:TPR repeat-containing protein (plasmid) [Calothrix sp. NIES-4101]|nr:TPR repeat-containing protein [Calothrix sp. NIES-4101]